MLIDKFKFNKVKLIVVSKTKTNKQILKIYNQGQRDFAESYIQESLIKIKQLPKDIIWHFIGPIQSNKTRDIANNFSWVHSVDRIKIARRLNAIAPKRLKILIQVNIDNEISKSGIKIEYLTNLIMAIKTMKSLNLKGLMCIPNKDNPTNAFKKMQVLKHKYNLNELSMGMSADYPQAISNGATIIRIGSAIFTGGSAS